jgi:hypothetical protein
MRSAPILFLLLSVLLSVPLSAQTFDELVRTLAAAESLDSEAVGSDGARSDTFRTFELLRGTATRAQLEKLLSHDSAIVRGYAVRALADREEAVDWPAVLQARAADTQKVITFEGCVRSEQQLGDVVVALARDRKLLSAEQWLDFAELLVQQHSPLYAREWTLRNLHFRDGFLHTIRDLAKSGDGPAQVALARYGVKKDLPLLVAWLSRDGVFDDTTAFLAAQQHADPSLLPVLVGLEAKARAAIAAGYGHRLREWFGAIATQQSAGTAAFLLRFVQDTPSEQALRRRQVVELLGEVMAAAGDGAVFAELRAELERLRRS